MKKLLFLVLMFLLTMVVVSASYFYYESYNFDKQIAGASKKDNMNIPINENAPVVSRSQMEIAAPVDTVWQVLTDIKKWPQWQQAVSETIVPEKVEEGTEFHWKADGLSFTSKIHTVNPHRAFGWTGKTIGTSAIHNWTFVKKDDHTLVIVEESLQGVFPRLFKNFFQKNLNQGVLTNLEELKAASEKVAR